MQSLLWMTIRSDTPPSFLPNSLLSQPQSSIHYNMPCSDYPNFIPTPSIPSIISTMSTTSISSPSSLTNTLPIIKSSTRPATPIDPMSPFTEQEHLLPVTVATTQSDELLHPTAGILSVDVPIYTHRLVNDFPDKQTNAYLSSQLLDSRLASTLDGHMDMGSPLYTLYKAFLQCHRLTTLVSTNTADAHHALCKQILHSIHEELEGDLFLAMYQLGMPAFADDVEYYCKELSDASPTLAPNTPTAFSSPLTNKELWAIEHSEAHWTGNFRWTPLPPDHPHFDEVCFHCHCLGHIWINCQFYTCPTCLCNASNHVQNCCPLHHRYNPTRTLSFSSSSSNHFTSSMGSIHPVPPPLADRLSSPPRRAFHGSCHTHVTTAHIHTPSIRFCGVRPPTPGMDDDDVYDSDAWRNINGE